MDAAAAFLASLEESKITTLQDAAKKPPIEILPPGMATLYGPNPGQSGLKKPSLALPSSQQQPTKPLLLEASAAAPISTSSESNGLPSAESGSSQNSVGAPAAPPTSESASTNLETNAPPQLAPDSSAPPVAESSDNAPPSDHNNVENQEQQASVQSVTESNGIEGSVPPASETTPIVPDAGHEQASNQGTRVRPELSMIDFS